MKAFTENFQQDASLQFFLYDSTQTCRLLVLAPTTTHYIFPLEAGGFKNNAANWKCLLGRL